LRRRALHPSAIVSGVDTHGASIKLAVFGKQGELGVDALQEALEEELQEAAGGDEVHCAIAPRVLWLHRGTVLAVPQRWSVFV
jgi:hypothetical protein